MKNNLSILLLLFISISIIVNLSCNSPSEENITEIVRPSTPIIDPPIILDTIKTKNHLIVFHDILKEEYDKFSGDYELGDVENNYDSIDIDSNIDFFVSDMLKEPKSYFRRYLFPLIDWNKNLSIFLNSENVMKTTIKKYGAAQFDLNNFGNVEDNDEDYDEYYSDENQSSSVHVNDRSFEIMWFVLQEFGMFKETYLNRKDTSTLELPIKNGENLIFKDIAIDTVKYNFIAFFPNFNHYLIVKAMFEKDQMYLINRENGETIETWGVPDFLEDSKDNVLSILKDDINPNSKNGIQTFEITQNGIIPYFEFETRDWTPKSISFVDKSTAYLKINVEMDIGEEIYEYKRVEISKRRFLISQKESSELY